MTADCRATEDFVDFADRLNAIVSPIAGAMAVGVIFDEQASVRSVCIHEPLAGVKHRWRERRNLTRDLPRIPELPAGPRCVADSRLDLNRRAAKVAQIESILSLCTREARLETLQRQQDNTLPPAYQTVSPYRCAVREGIEPGSRWIYADREGSWWRLYLLHPDDSKTLLFAPIQDVLPEPSHPDTVARRCSKSAELSQLVECMAEHRWELLQ